MTYKLTGLSKKTLQFLAINRDFLSLDMKTKVVQHAERVNARMLKKLCFHVYAQKSLFIAENCNAFLGHSQPHPVSLEFLELVPS